jgi:hypothetical protein
MPKKIAVRIFYTLKGQCHEIFVPHYFHQTILPSALIHGLKCFAYGFVFAEKIDAEIAEIGSRGLNETSGSKFVCQRSPLILIFFSNYSYVMFTYLFVFVMFSL